MTIRARDLGLPLAGEPGPLNAITDIAGVHVGMTTLIEDRPRTGRPRPVRTGVTAIVPHAESRDPVPVYRSGAQVGRATSLAWGPTIKKMVAFGSLPASLTDPGTTLSVEWSVEGERGTAAATVVPLPFLDLERKRS